MTSRSRLATLGPVAAFFMVAAAAVARADDARPDSAPTDGTRADATLDAMRGDAQLSDVCFADAEQGWAVGDRGVVWHTADGGRHWTLQFSGVDCRLTSVFFLDAKIGWAAGGSTQPYTHASSGVVLRTRDGGERWEVDRKLILPAVEQIGFFDPTHGWAVGQTSAIFPSGVFATDDGGRAWSALPSGESRGWLAGDFIDRDTGAVAGRASGLAAIRRRGVESLAADYGLRALTRMKLVAPAGGWLVGDGGLVLETHDLGKSWQTADADVPSAVRNHFDFAALEVRGRHCWIAGTPGTRVLHTADAGRSWSLGATGQNLPIRGLAFVDERVGWAVGDLGTILATSDGGKTWRKQRGGGERAAFVGFYGRPGEIPLELVARLSADEGYLGAMEILNREDVDVRAAAATDPVLQAHEAGVQAGASAAATAWQFPLRQAAINVSADQLVEGWNQVNDTRAIDKLEAHIVARIRMWRPSVVFTTAADSQANDPLSHLVNQVVLRAVERAGDPTFHADQISETLLPPWKVQKVFATLPPGQTGTLNVNTAQLAARLGRSVGEWAAPARGLIARHYVPPTANVGFRLLVDHIPQEVGQRDFFSGIALSPGGEARRRFLELPDHDLDTMRRQAQMRRNLQAILAQADGDDSREGRFLADIGEQTRSMEPSRAAEVVFQLGQRYFRQGRWELAAECFDLLVQRYPNHPLAGAALVWLVQYYASAEAAWRSRTLQQINAQQVTSQQATGEAPLSKRGRGRAAVGSGQAGDVKLAAGMSAPRQVRQASSLVADLRGSETPRAERAKNYAKQLEQIQPALFAEPSVRFPLAAADRQQGLPRQAERYYLGLRHGRPHDAWWACAQMELWLAEPKGVPSPKEIWTCARSSEKPRLDGRLDEPMWRAGNSVELRSTQRDDAEWRAVAMLAYDEEFLYIGVSCSRAEGFEYSQSDLARPRDSDLSDQDRVEIVLDVDRDFATYYRLTVDHRGWTGESCWQDTSWNPDWFVAAGHGEGLWTAEAAIPWAELTGEKPSAKRVWAAGVQRVVPGVGFQSWTTPAASEIMPEGLGILVFQ